MNLKENLEEFAELQRKLELQNHQNQSSPPTSNSVLKRVLEEGSLVQNSRQNSSTSMVPAMEETKLASVLSMVMCCQNITTVMDDLFEHVRKEIKTQCVMLNINPGEFRSK